MNHIVRSFIRLPSFKPLWKKGTPSAVAKAGALSAKAEQGQTVGDDTMALEDLAADKLVWRILAFLTMNI